MERPVTPEDETRYLAERHPDRVKSDEMDRRMSRIPIRERLEINRRVNVEGASLVDLVEQWEREARS